MLSQILSNILRGPKILFAKQSIVRREWPFELSLGDYSVTDYTKIIPALRDVERRLRELRADTQGVRMIHLRDTVLFLGERSFDIPYDDFVSQVDISHVGQFYRDSLGATTIVTTRDTADRPLQQGVRIVALPQPNYASFMGKGLLDVYKLESIDYEQDEQRVWMLTVHSPNGSAVCDDGYTSFKRSACGKRTEVTFLACQNFPVPPLMALARMDRWTWFKTVVTEAAYRRFFNDMMRNIIDCYDGIDFHVGRAPRVSAAAAQYAAEARTVAQELRGE